MSERDEPLRVCPNCGRPVETHEMFSPPRCPVVRLHFPENAAEPSEAIVAYSSVRTV